MINDDRWSIISRLSLHAHIKQLISHIGPISAEFWIYDCSSCSLAPGSQHTLKTPLSDPIKRNCPSCENFRALIAPYTCRSCSTTRASSEWIARNSTRPSEQPHTSTSLAPLTAKAKTLLAIRFRARNWPLIQKQNRLLSVQEWDTTYPAHAAELWFS